MNEEVTKIMEIQGQMESEKSRSDNWNRDVARLVDPSSNTFNQRLNYDFGEYIDIFDSTAPLALNRFVAAIEGILTPRATRWHRIKPPESAGKLGESKRVADWYEGLTETLFDARYAGKSNFAGATSDSYRNLGTAGGAYIYIESDDTDSFKYAKVPASEAYYTFDIWGRLSRFHRKFEMAVSDIPTEYPDADLPSDLLERAKNKPLDKEEIVHAVFRNENMADGRADAAGMEWRSCTVLCSKNIELRSGGFRAMPYVAGTWNQGDNETYPRSVGMMALATIRMINTMERDMIVYANRAAQPPNLAADMDLPSLNLSPDSVNPGFLSPDGKPLVIPYQQGGDTGLTLEMIQDKRRTIEAFFLVDMFQMLVETPEMTATEWIGRMREKATLLAPAMGRMQSSYLAPIIEREINIAFASGMVPPPPDEVFEFGGRYDIDYLSPMARMLSEGEAIEAVMRQTEFANQYIAIGLEDVVDNINSDASFRLISRALGAPEDTLVDEELVAQRRAQRAQQQAQQAEMEQAPAMASAAKDAATAAQTAGLV